MNRTIDELFEEYDHGRLTRRQLAQGFLAFLIPSLAGAQTPSGAVEARTINHVQICVADMEKSKAFYGAVLGTAKVADYVDGAVQTLALPGNAGWISVRLDPKRPGQMDHYAVGVDNFDAVKSGTAIKKAIPGANVTGDVAKSSAVWVVDPDGIRVQIMSKDRAG